MNYTFLLFLLGRVLFGGYFIINGYKHFKHLKSYTAYAESKGVPMAKAMVVITGLMILLGGLGILLGMYVKFAIFLLATFLIFVTPQMHKY